VPLPHDGTSGQHDREKGGPDRALAGGLADQERAIRARSPAWWAEQGRPWLCVLAGRVEQVEARRAARRWVGGAREGRLRVLAGGWSKGRWKRSPAGGTSGAAGGASSAAKSKRNEWVTRKMDPEKATWVKRQGLEVELASYFSTTSLRPERRTSVCKFYPNLNHVKTNLAKPVRRSVAPTTARARPARPTWGGLASLFFHFLFLGFFQQFFLHISICTTRLYGLSYAHNSTFTKKYAHNLSLERKIYTQVILQFSCVHKLYAQILRESNLC
jgi:hypothetical protein